MGDCADTACWEFDKEKAYSLMLRAAQCGVLQLGKNLKACFHTTSLHKELGQLSAEELPQQSIRRENWIQRREERRISRIHRKGECASVGTTKIRVRKLERQEYGINPA